MPSLFAFWGLYAILVLSPRMAKVCGAPPLPIVTSIKLECSVVRSTAAWMALEKRRESFKNYRLFRRYVQLVTRLIPIYYSFSLNVVKAYRTRWLD